MPDRSPATAEAARNDGFPSSAPTPARQALGALYDELARELAALAPVCQLSGRCCRFASHGHALFVTDLELALLVERHGPPPAPAVDGACPYQSEEGACGAREGRPLGCRVYFCDPAYEQSMPELAERYHRELQDLHARHGAPYRYGELLARLARDVR